MKNLKSGVTIKIELGQDIKLTPAGKLELVVQLLGDQPIYDEEGEEIGRTPTLISKEQAIELLNRL